ncbi:hypothetical protein WJX74_002758 [Apatococcus lobatus]|uniref:RNA cytidine acetyltransferase n=1 Tax=Apatococcus lobatus TaxID=904363 RepID=A0AAW1RT59_9CHLO
MRKKVDPRIRTLVDNCVQLHQRGLLVLVGDKGSEQVVNLHYLLSRALVKSRPSVLWCYKKDLEYSSHRKKRERQVSRKKRQGLLDPEKEDPFTLFIASTTIRYCFYKDTHRILGNTFGMCVLQDFEGLTPNLLARTMETVEGGGLCIMLIKTLTSLTQLYSLVMDVHSRLRSHSHQQVTGRFNERLVLSLASNPAVLMMDDELNILPTSSHVRQLQAPAADSPEAAGAAVRTAELKELKESLLDTQPAGSLVQRCKTLDQARAVVTFLDAASEKTLRSTVALTAARGRGKSAALGLAIAGAIGLGYSNIFVTAPSPENLRTLFEFIFKGLDAMDYKEHIDYDLKESTNPAFGKAIVRVNIFRQHRQTVQYIQPQHHAQLSQAELVVIDEAAAIPLPLVKAMLGPYLVFLCSTVNGYEGTGRSLSLKLITQLRAEGAKVASSAKEAEAGGSSPRTFREVILQEPIRYSAGDKVESWLHELLCLDAAEHVPPTPARLPHPSECNLYYIERDTLFSYHKGSEAFLQRMMALYVASHYRNTPNDLLLMSDAPAHHLFALLGPLNQTKNALPDVLCVAQVALEGAISKQAALASLSHGTLPQGDMIPWTISQQYQDTDFPSLSGARIVRIAVHPDLNRAGYGSRTVELLRRYYQGELSGISTADGDASEEDDPKAEPSNGGIHQERIDSNGKASAGPGSTLQEEVMGPRAGLPPLLTHLADRPPEQLQWLGVSFGLTQSLHSFWRRSGFSTLYLRQAPSDVTGENSAIMLSALQSPMVESVKWLDAFILDFRTRLAALLAGAFRSFPPALALSLLDPKLSFGTEETERSIEQGGTVIHKAGGSALSPYDLKRLQAYSNNLVDHHLILDLLPPLAQAYFLGHLPASLTPLQAAILCSLGLQQNDIPEVEAALNLPGHQVKDLFNKAMRKLHGHLKAVEEAAVARTLPQVQPINLQPHEKDLETELQEGAQEVNEAMQAALRPEALAKYAIKGTDADFGTLEGQVPNTGIISVLSRKLPKADADDAAEDAGQKPKSKSKQLYSRKGSGQKPFGHQRSAKKARI